MIPNQSKCPSQMSLLTTQHFDNQQSPHVDILKRDEKSLFDAALSFIGVFMIRVQDQQIMFFFGFFSSSELRLLNNIKTL